LVDAERRKAEIEVALAGGIWRDPRRGDIRLSEWVEQWLPTRHDLRATTWARLETTMEKYSRMAPTPRSTASTHFSTARSLEAYRTAFRLLTNTGSAIKH
jgi:hypothetical protein